MPVCSAACWGWVLGLKNAAKLKLAVMPPIISLEEPMSIKRFAIVDNHNDNVAYFQKILETLGYTGVMSAPNGQAGLDLIEKEHAQFICVRWEIEPMPGYLFVQKLRGKHRKQFLPVLIYTEQMSDEDLNLAKELGFKNILKKPFQDDEVKETVRQMLEAENTMPSIEKKLRKMETLIEDDRTSEALALVTNSMMKPGPWLMRAAPTVADLWISVKKFDRAEKVINAALGEDAEFVPILHMKSRLLSAQGKHDEAIAILKSLADEGPKNMATMLSLGSAFTEAGKLDEAKEAVETITAIDPDNDDAKEQLGKIAFREGDMELATQLLAQSGHANKLARYFNDLAIAYVKTEDFERGIETYKNALKIITNSNKRPLLQYNVGLAYQKMGDQMKAFENFCYAYIENPAYEKADASLAKASKEIKAAGKKLNPNLVKQVKGVRESHKLKMAG